MGTKRKISLPTDGKLNPRTKIVASGRISYYLYSGELLFCRSAAMLRIVLLRLTFFTACSAATLGVSMDPHPTPTNAFAQRVLRGSIAQGFRQLQSCSDQDFVGCGSQEDSLENDIFTDATTGTCGIFRQQVPVSMEPSFFLFCISMCFNPLSFCSISHWHLPT